MIEEDLEQEAQFYQKTILAAINHINPQNSWDDAAPELFIHFNALAQDDRSHARRLSAMLLADERREVRLGAIKLIGSSRIKDDVLSVALAHVALKQKSLREDALLALWRVGTRRVLPQLLLFADKGYSSALYMIRKILQTPEEIEQGISIARKYISADDYELREAALFLLQRYSTMEVEDQWVLAAVQSNCAKRRTLFLL